MSDKLIERLRESMCRDNMGCMPEVCICAVAEEAADRIEALEANPLYNPNIALHKAYSEYKTRCYKLEAALRDREWISVKDRLPEYKQPCIVATRFGDVFTDGHKVTKDEWGGYITHWMPLPAPPEGLDHE